MGKYLKWVPERDDIKHDVVAEVFIEASRIFSDDKHFIHARDFYGPCRYNFITIPRCLLYGILYAYHPSYTHVGRWTKKDHTSVMHGVERYPYYLDKDPALVEKYEHLLAFIFEKDAELRALEAEKQAEADALLDAVAEAIQYAQQEEMAEAA